MSQTIRVLVFGTTGTGKTSLCNALTGENQKVSNDALGVTFKSYTYEEVEISEGKSLIITDTVGLNESARGSVPSRDAVKALIKLLQDSKEGYNLLIQSFRIPRITQAEENNYEFFVKTISGSKIPTILVASGCENLEPMSKWKEENGNTFERMGLEYKDIICSCFASGGRLASVYDELRDESRQAVIEAIEAYATVEPVKLYTTMESFMILLKRSWNWLAGWLGVDKLMFQLNEPLIQLLIRIGFSREEATLLLGEVGVPTSK
ncbi:GTPase domain-containing protein [Merismopedia glauca]|uniref:GTP-binding protein n=1 Tax=Merismopedia glauca CCAP 1448/3 TaxID=1296344 RepID=A0A2T1CAF3_9CYAN|nr:GTPase domain-containing protein [Merismopedia glauca]PSB05256.1 GTP-binding protein [Merismopedia glauca CCAP 1448/3]